MRHAILAALAAVALASPAGANQCPMLAAQIEEALAGAGAAGLPADTVTAVTALLEEGRRLHDAGDHAASEATLTAAKQMLGLQ